MRRIFAAVTLLFASLAYAQTTVVGGPASSGSATAVSTAVAAINGALGNDGSLLMAHLYADCTTPYKDSSGKGNDGTAGTTQPACTKQGLTFIPNQYYNLPTAVSSAAYTYVARMCLFATPASSNGAANPTFLQSTSTSGLGLGLFGYAGSNTSSWYSPAMGTMTSTIGTTKSAVALSGCPVVVWTIGTSGGNLDQIFIDGKEVTYQAQGFSSGALGNGTYQVGGGSSFVNGYFLGNLGATLAINRKVTAAESLALTNVLKNYTATNGMTDIPVPTAGATPVIACGVDSITAGFGATSYCTATLLSSLLQETVSISNAPAVSGQTMHAAQQRIVQSFHPLYAPNALHNTAVIFGCTNDKGSQYGTVSTCPGYVASALQKLRPLGWKGIALPILSQTSADAAKNTFNAALRLQCESIAEACVSDTDPNLYADGASVSTTYFQDGTHPTLAGQTLLAQYVANAYNWLYFRSTSASPTVVTASTYTIRAFDTYIQASPSASSTYTLPNCIGLPLRAVYQINNPQSTQTVVVKTANSAQTANGVDYSSTGLTIGSNATVTFRFVPGPTASGGCTWQY